MSDLPAQILHVDDDDEVLAVVREYLEGEDIEGWGRPEVIAINSFDEALHTLEERRVDLVVLDVRLGGHEKTDVAPTEEAGVKTLESIKQRRFVPIVFWTGLPRSVEHLGEPLVRIGDKSSDVTDLLRLLRELFATGLPKINRALLRLIEEEQCRYMWEFVAPHWDELRADGDHLGLAHLLVRRLGRSLSGPGVQRIAAELGAERSEPFPEGTIHAAEMYIVPPLLDTPAVAGEIVREPDAADGGAWWFVLTPSCDLEHVEKLDTVLVAQAIPATADQRIADWIAESSNTRRQKVEDLVRGKTGGQDDRWIFLPAVPTIPDLVVDLQRLRSMPLGEFEALERVGSLSSPFAEAAINRFGRYYGRVGTDDLYHPAVLSRLNPPAKS